MISPRDFVTAVVALALASVAVPAAAADVGLDPTFSANGKVSFAGPGSQTLSFARASGDLYLAGEQRAGKSSVPFVGRIEANGTLDPTFSGDGLQELTLTGKFWLTGNTVDAQGRTVLVAQSPQRTVVARFTPTGELDPAFSGDGLREFAGGASSVYLFPRVVVDGEGRIVLATMNALKAGGSNVVIRRLLASGALDSTWSGDGAKIVNHGVDDWVEGVQVDARNRVLLGSETGGRAPASVYRFLPDGSADPSFSNDGVATFQLQPHLNTFPLGIGINASGAITVAAASCCQRDGTTYGAARFLPNGNLDSSYGDGGIVGLTCLQCHPTWGDVAGGRVAIVVDPYNETSSTRLTRMSASGTRIEHQSVDIYPATGTELVVPVAIAGGRTLVGGSANGRAFVARLP